MTVTQPIHISRVAQHYGISSTTVIRWIQKGYRGRRLRGKQVGKNWYTTWAAVAEFEGESVVPSVESLSEANEAANRLLVSMGVQVG